jgi:hypothetical protein
VQSFMNLLASTIDVAALAVLLIFVPLFVLFTVRARRGRPSSLRPIRAYERIRQLLSQATETGQAVHLGLGSGQIGSEATPEALMGITVFDYVARNAAQCDCPVQGTTGDATILAASQGILQRSRRDARAPERSGGQEICFYGPEPFAYAAGALGELSHQEHLANVLVGRFDAEGLWMSESAGSQELVQLGGTTDPSAAALMLASLDEAVIGEEVFAAGAYLHRPSHLGSLAAQDSMRIVIMLSVLAGVVMASLGYWG